MTRYFFDVNIRALIEYDHSGQFLPDREHAQQLADLIAMDLSCTRAGESGAMEIQVRTPDGALVSSIPVDVNDDP